MEIPTSIEKSSIITLQPESTKCINIKNKYSWMQKEITLTRCHTDSYVGTTYVLTTFGCALGSSAGLAYTGHSIGLSVAGGLGSGIVGGVLSCTAVQCYQNYINREVNRDSKDYV